MRQIPAGRPRQTYTQHSVNLCSLKGSTRPTTQIGESYERHRGHPNSCSPSWQRAPRSRSRCPQVLQLHAGGEGWVGPGLGHVRGSRTVQFAQTPPRLLPPGAECKFGFIAHFGEVPAPRIPRKCRHELVIKAPTSHLLTPPAHPPYTQMCTHAHKTAHLYIYMNNHLACHL